MSDNSGDGERAAIERREVLAAQVRDFARGMAEANKMLADMAAQLAKAFEPMAAQARGTLGSATRIGTGIAEHPGALVQVWGPALVEGFKRLPPKFQENLLTLGEHGWYLDPHLPLSAVWNLAEAFKEGRSDEADSALADHFTSRLDEIERELFKRAPKRAKLMRSAFAAHRRGEFDLSIPVLLAQADGISVDATREAGGGSLFRDEKGSPLTAAYVRQLAGGEFLSAMLAPLAQKLPISATEKRRKDVDNWTALNRHMVLHGEALDYGTEINSLKAISLVNYVASMLLETDDKGHHDPHS